MDFLSPVLNLIGSRLLDKYSRIHGISDKLKSWRKKLPRIQAALDSAEEKQMFDDDPDTVLWLADLKDLAYDMEDLLDNFSADAKWDPSKAQASKRPHCLIACCSPFRPRPLILGHRMMNEIEDIDQRLEQAVAGIRILGLVQNSRSREKQMEELLPRFTSLPEPKFVGREKEMEEMLSRLTGSEASDHSVRPFTVVSIVGMGGLGKTILARELYYHESLRNADFAVKAWVCVSEVFDMAAITKSILDQVAPSSSGTEKDLDLNQIQNSLKEKLSGKKFFLVLDNVWNDMHDELESLMNPLYSGSKGSRILLTTRNFEVARLMGDRDPKRLDFLSLEESLSLLAYHSIGEQNFEGHPHLQEISVQLVKKCKGLPLSIKTIGGMLRFKSDEKWKEVLAHVSWDKEQGKIPPALKFSYNHLPFHLKRCFAACALFPKDYMFDQDELIRLWIIQGLLQKETGKTYREVGMKNLRQLEAISFIQEAREKKNCYSMHDLVNDLAKSVNARSYYSSDEYKEGSTACEVSLEKVRHAVMVTQQHERCISKRFEVFRSMKKLRTFMSFQISEDQQPNVSVSQDVIHDLIMDMKTLQMLSLRYFRVTQVPDRIGELKLLRSVDFSHTNIQMLPESICELVELQSLLLRGCKGIKKLPRNIHKLINLLHLDITGTNNLQEMPPRIGDLTNLEILSGFVVGKEAGQELKQLEPLGCLQRELHIRKLLNVDDVEDARIANLSGKEAVLELSLDWGSSSEISGENDHQFKLLDHLRPPRKIESLEIRHYGAKRFPKWFDTQRSMSNVLSITLTGCRSVDLLPPFGQLPSLERLDISGLEAISSIGPEFYGSRRPSFRSLRSLSFGDMGAWEKWSSHGEDENEQPFPCLRQLVVRKCPNLKGGCSTLCLPSLVEIDVDGCDGRFLKCLAGLTSMTKMEISGIPELVHFEGSLSTSWVALEEMRIVSCPQFKSLVGGDGGKQVPPKLKILEIRGCHDIEKLPDNLFGFTSLIEMRIVDCPRFKSFVGGDGGKQVPPKLKILEIRGCRDIEKLPDDLFGFTSLIRIVDCPRFKSFLEGEGGKRVPPKLKILEIRGCRDIEKLPDDLCGLTSLNEIVIRDCEKFCSFPSGGLPPELRKLTLRSCPRLPQSQLISSRLPNSLEELFIDDLEELVSMTELVIVGSPLSRSLRVSNIIECRRLTTFTNSLRHLSALSELRLVDCPELEMDIFPTLPCNLSSFSLYSCPKVKSLPNDMHHLTSLKELNIGDCPALEMGIFPSLPSNLSNFILDSCPKVKSLPNDMHGLISLKELHIRGCEGITRLPPRGGLPPNLEILRIGACRNLNQPIGEWGLSGLTALRLLSILGEMGYVDEMECFPPDDDADWSRLLPSSLVSLHIGGMKKLERMGRGLRHHLTSLQSLDIINCESLRCLPDDGLPESLEYLHIWRCPSLVEKCREGTGEYWPHLRFIPLIVIPYIQNDLVM